VAGGQSHAVNSTKAATQKVVAISVSLLEIPETMEGLLSMHWRIAGSGIMLWAARACKHFAQTFTPHSRNCILAVWKDMGGHETGCQNEISTVRLTILIFRVTTFQSKGYSKF
jgi:hypothetical protein